MDESFASYLAAFVGGAFATNAVPHWVSGLMGRPFPSPFAKPPGKGVSSARVNVVWGFFNGCVAVVVLWRQTPWQWPHLLACGLGALAMALLLANHFGKLDGGSLAAQKT